MKKIIYFFFFITTLFLNAQDVSFKAELSRKNIGVNERFRVEFKMNKDGDNFSPPSFENFNVIMGPSQSIQHSWVNGVKSFSKTFSYVLEPKKQGTLSIESASITIDNKTYKTDPISIEVGKPVKNQNNQNGQNPPPSNPWANMFPLGFDPFNFDPFFDNDDSDENTSQQKFQLKPSDLFILADVSNRNPYLNEAVVVTYKIYISEKIGVGINSFKSVPEYKDFVSQEIEQDQIKVSDCSYDNKKYRCATIKQVILFPQKEGKITISPLVITLNIQGSVGHDRFGRPIMSQDVKDFSSGIASINVKPLPTEGRPTNFSGAVGNFNIESSLSKNTTATAESVSTTVTISGNGNFKFFEFPHMVFPSNLDVYDPEKKDNVNKTSEGLVGSVSQIYTIVPQNKGIYPIPGVNFSYFDPKTGKYQTIDTQELKLDVNSGKDTVINSHTDNTVPEKISEFKFLKLNSNLQKIGEPRFLYSTIFFLLMGILVLLVPIFLVIYNIYNKRASDVQGNKIRNADKLAKKYLSEAKKLIGNKEEFYQSLEKGIYNFIKAKLRLENKDINSDVVFSEIEQKGVSSEYATQFKNLVETCDRARYSPYTQTDMENDYQKASILISNLDRQLNK